LATLEILRRMREAGYQGGKTGFYALVASLRPKLAKPLVRFEGLPGEFSQHDFGQVKVEFLNGTCQQIHFFASRLKYSRCMRVSSPEQYSLSLSDAPAVSANHSQKARLHTEHASSARRVLPSLNSDGS